MIGVGKMERIAGDLFHSNVKPLSGTYRCHDHEMLTYKFQGRHFRLADVHGHVVKDILA